MTIEGKQKPNPGTAHIGPFKKRETEGKWIADSKNFERREKRNEKQYTMIILMQCFREEEQVKL